LDDQAERRKIKPWGRAIAIEAGVGVAIGIAIAVAPA
jgi:hypothetical protein